MEKCTYHDAEGLAHIGGILEGYGERDGCGWWVLSRLFVPRLADSYEELGFAWVEDGVLGGVIRRKVRNFS
jgi:hypothetical protein